MNKKIDNLDNPEIITLEFYCVDFWGRALYKIPNENIYFCSLDKLCGGLTKEEILKSITIDDLCYFGTDPEDDPMGAPVLGKDKKIYLSGRAVIFKLEKY